MANTKKTAGRNSKQNKMKVSKNSKKIFKQRNNLVKRGVGKINKVSQRMQGKNKSGRVKTNENKSATNNQIGLKTSRRRLKEMSLKERMMEKLKAAKFRFVNECLYTSDGKEMETIFKNKESYNEYHQGFRQQVAQWPLNPVDVIIKNLISRAKSDDLKIADFGCGEAKIAESLEGRAKVYSFDLVALNERVTQCNMAHTPLRTASIDVAVFCLSLMSTNISAYISESNRVLKDGGLLKIAEVESRFQNIDIFITTIERFGFKLVSQDLSHKMFYFINFKKVSNLSKNRKRKLPELSLKPCLYKKR